MNLLNAKLFSYFLHILQLDKLLLPGMNILLLNSLENAKWAFLMNLGVLFEPTLEVYLEQVRRNKREICEKGAASISTGIIVNRFYKDLVIFCKNLSNILWTLR